MTSRRKHRKTVKRPKALVLPKGDFGLEDWNAVFRVMTRDPRGLGPIGRTRDRKHGNILDKTDHTALRDGLLAGTVFVSWMRLAETDGIAASLIQAELLADTG